MPPPHGYLLRQPWVKHLPVLMVTGFKWKCIFLHFFFFLAPNTCETGFVLFPLPNTAWAHGKRNSLLVIQKVGKSLMSWSRRGQGTRTGKRQEERGEKKKRQICAQLPACNRTAQPTRRLRCVCVTAPEALPRAWGKQVSTEGVEQHLKQAERGAPESRSHLSLLSTERCAHILRHALEVTAPICAHILLASLETNYRERNKLRETPPAPVSRTARYSV